MLVKIFVLNTSFYSFSTKIENKKLKEDMYGYKKFYVMELIEKCFNWNLQKKKSHVF